MLLQHVSPQAASNRMSQPQVLSDSNSGLVQAAHASLPIPSPACNQQWSHLHFLKSIVHKESDGKENEAAPAPALLLCVLENVLD